MESKIFLVALRHEGRINIVYVADDAAPDILAERCHVRAVQVRIGFHQKLPALSCRPIHFLCFLSIHGHGLFTQHVLAGLQRRLHPLNMKVIGQWNIYGLNVLISKQLVITAISLLEPILLLKGLRLL